MSIRFSLPFVLALGAWPTLATGQERIERYIERYGSAQRGFSLQHLRAIDALWPAEGIRKVSEEEFRRDWTQRYGPEQELELLSEAFLRLQALEYGIETRLDRRLAFEHIRAVPRRGADPYQVAPPIREALLQESEPNESPASANPMSCADQMYGALTGFGDVDVFVVNTTAPSRFVARVDPDLASTTPLVDPTLELLSEGGQVLAFNDDRNGTYPELDLLLPSGTWFFRVASRSIALNGAYIFSPDCNALPVVNANSPLLTNLGPHAAQGFVLEVLQDDAFRLAALSGNSTGLEIEWFDRSGLRTLAISRVGALPGEAAIRSAAKAGVFLARVRHLASSTTPVQIDVVPTGTGLPLLPCTTTSASFLVGGEWNPVFQWQAATITDGQVAIKEIGWPHATRARIDDAYGRELSSVLLGPESQASIHAVIGTQALIGLSTRNAGLPEVSWRDTPAAARWSRPQPTAGAYAGPTDLQVAALQGFTFVDDHLSPAGILTARLRTEFDISAGSWDVGIFVDRCRIEVDTPQGRTAFAPFAARLSTSNQAGWSSTVLYGGASELQNDDDLYLAANLADSSVDAQELTTLEFDFDLSTLGASGSQLSALRFFAEWYFGGNATASGALTPPSFDDSSEEANVLARAVELARHSAGTWDHLADVMPFEDRVELTLGCQSIPMQAASAADEAIATVDPANRARGFSYRASSPVAISARASARAATPWRGSVPSAAWRSPNPQHPGPTRKLAVLPLPPDVVGPLSEVRLRVRWDACWDDQIWDVHHYYDYARLEFDLGSGMRNAAPIQLALGPDIARFTGPSGVVFATGNLTDLAARDNVYARTQREDHDTQSFGASAEHSDEFLFDLSPWLTPGSGSAIVALAGEVLLFKNGAGSSPTPTTASGSEELLLRSDLDLEIYDFATQTWIALSGAPSIQGYPFSATCSSVAVLDPQLRAFDVQTGLPLAQDDDSGGGLNARVDLNLGDPLTGVSDTLFVVTASPFAGALVQGDVGFSIDAPFGYRGRAPFELTLGSTFAVEMRGPDGWLAFGWHSILPPPPVGIALGAPTSGWLVFDPTGFFLTLPNGMVIANGRASGALPTPLDPLLIGATIYGQGLLFDPISIHLQFVNEDRVILQL